MSSRATIASMFATFAALGLAFAIAINNIDDRAIHLLLTIFYVAAILGITRLVRREP